MQTKRNLISKSISSHDRNVSYQVGGNQNASEYILFANGTFSDTNDWVKQKRKFEKLYKLIFFNYSNVEIDKDDNKVNTFFDVITGDIKAILENERVEKIIIISHSMGGPVGLYFAVRFPGVVKKLVLINSGVEVGLRFKIIITGIIKAMEEDFSFSYLYPFTMAWWYSTEYLECITKDKDGYVTFEKLKSPLNKDQYDVLLKFLYCVFKIRKIIHKFESIKSPVLFISARNDFVFPVETQKKHLYVINNIRFESFDKLTHNIHVEEYEQVNNMIMSFIQK